MSRESFHSLRLEMKKQKMKKMKISRKISKKISKKRSGTKKISGDKSLNFFAPEFKLFI